MKGWSRLAGPVLLLASTAAGLAIVEALYRAHHNHRYQRLVASSAETGWLVLPDDQRAYAMRPSYEAHGSFFGDKSKSFTFRTNSDGFRDRPVGPRRAGVRRVVVLGDSYTFGWAVAADDVFPRRLEEELRSRGRGVEALNCGVPGYGTVAELEVARLTLPRYQPDVVLLAYVMNDAEPQGTVPWPPARTFRGCPLWIWEDVKEQINARLLGPDHAFPLCKQVHDFDYGKGFLPDSRKWRESRAALAGIAEVCRARGVTLVVAILPDFTNEFDERYRWRSIHETVARWGSELGITTFDLLPSFLRERVPSSRYRVEGDGHPNAAAHRRIGELLADDLDPVLFPAAPAPIRP
jgi:lysophospholipase L1-like esterase